MFTSCHQNAENSLDVKVCMYEEWGISSPCTVTITDILCFHVKVANRFLENLAEFKCWAQEHIHKEIKSRQNLGNVATIQFRILCLPISYLKLKIKTYGAIILHADLYVHETCSLTIRKKHCGVFEENIWILQRGNGMRLGKTVL
jgi:hypothetical protein